MRLGLFTADQVCTLCGVSPRQLAHWDDTGFFKPKYADKKRHAFNRIYSFRDVVGLRTVGLLRNKYKVPLTPDLRQISEELKKTPDADWSTLVFYRDPIGKIYFVHPGTGELVGTRPHGQRPLFKMSEIIRKVEQNLERMNRRKPRQIGKIDRNRFIAQNADVIAGTRIPTAAIYRLHKAGFNADAIIREYPRLTIADVEAAIQNEHLKVAS